MKKGFVLILLVGGLFFLLQSFMQTMNSDEEIPEEVNKLLVLSCNDCHSTSSKNQDAQEAVDFEKWDEQRLTKKIGLLGKIGDLVEQDKMPPEKYLTFKPDRALSESQKKIIVNWAEKEASELMEGN